MKQENQQASLQDPLITVVVPVYNTQKYLRQCLDSICGQSYDHLDVILVDDGSTDRSAEICDEFCRKDFRFRLIHQENAGLGAARNKGIDQAQGEYICFVDSDDWIHPDYVRSLYENLASYHADLSICSFHIFNDGSAAPPDNQEENSTDEIQVMDRIALLETLMSDETNTVLVAWNKMVPRNWFQEFRFENRWHEDQFMINQYILKCQTAVLTSAKLYEYRKRLDSIMGSVNRSDLRHLDEIDALEQRIKYFYTEEYKSIWKAMFLQYLNNLIVWFVRLTNRDNFKELKKIIYPRFVWGFRQYLRMGGLFRKRSHALILYAFLFSPRLYKLCRDHVNS